MHRFPKRIQSRDIYSILLLCAGYFVDFYDLTIMSVSYNALFHDQFHIQGVAAVQKLYFIVSAIQAVGILCGAIIFGVLGDKIGRARVLKYSIFIYSLSTLLVLWTHSLPLFFLLRFFSYFGLATEFSTSTVLIMESLPVEAANFGTSFLYIFGVLGGMTATFIGFVSWKTMFFIGAVIGLGVYLCRHYILESTCFFQSKVKNPFSLRASFELLKKPRYLKGVLRYLLMILPFQSIITVMFVFPMLFVHTLAVGDAVKILLLGFFIGNIISCVLGAVLTHSFLNYKAIMYAGLILFVYLMLHFDFIHAKTLFIYALGLGVVGGAYPVTWAQQLALEYDVRVRCTISNLLFGLGRVFGIVLNTLLVHLMSRSQIVIVRDIFVIEIIIGLLALFSITLTPNLYRLAYQTQK